MSKKLQLNTGRFLPIIQLLDDKFGCVPAAAILLKDKIGSRMMRVLIYKTKL